MLEAAIGGFALGFSLILAIGAQNAFVLRQGLRRAHVFAICLTCAFSDAALIAAGVGGAGFLAGRAPWLPEALRWGGAAFLFAYGARSFLRGWKGGEALIPSEANSGSLSAALAACLLLTWANPHVYLDTVVLIGSVSTQWPGREAAFAAGAMVSSFVFFFSLGYGARLFVPLFARPAAWRVLEFAVGAVMWAIAAGLALQD
jgi:L-lysine exporter family protein LysE/ArgO